jgi:hypothetical protein
MSNDGVEGGQALTRLHYRRSHISLFWVFLGHLLGWHFRVCFRSRS